MKTTSQQAEKLLSKNGMNLSVREEWAFELLRSMVMEEELYATQASEEIQQDQEERLVEKAVRLADLLAEKLTKIEQPTDQTPIEYWVGKGNYE